MTAAGWLRQGWALLVLPGCTPGLGLDAEHAPIISIDGSSTVFPINEAMAEDFRSVSGARVTIGISGTGGGFAKFCSGETAITGASRPIKPDEVQACAAAHIEYIELPVAFDGISVVVNPVNQWVDQIKLSELRALWQPDAQGKVKRWSQVRTGWPEREIHLFGPGVDSGTYDYFTLAVVGIEHSSRGDFTSSEDDNLLVQGVSRDPLALGFFGYAYYRDNRSQLSLVGVDAERGEGPVRASPESVRNGTYSPLSRPVFLYVNRAASERAEVQSFVEFYLARAAQLVTEVGYIPLPARAYELATKRFLSHAVGSVFGGTGSRLGVTVEAILAAE